MDKDTIARNMAEQIIYHKGKNPSKEITFSPEHLVVLAEEYLKKIPSNVER